jgi:hypothetical protein
VRVIAAKLIAAAIVTVCIGLQALEATGRWDRTLVDSQDEAAIVTAVLCIGMAVVVARTVQAALSPRAVRISATFGRPLPRRAAASRHLTPTASGLPLPLRI